MASTQLIYKFRSKFPEFDQASDPDIAVSLDTSMLWIDKVLWSERDYDMAVMFWAAHFLSLKLQQLASVQFGGTGSSDLFIHAIRFGERSVSFGQRQHETAAEKMLGPGEQMLLSTIYGSAYIQLRARNIIPIAIV